MAIKTITTNRFLYINACGPAQVDSGEDPDAYDEDNAEDAGGSGDSPSSSGSPVSGGPEPVTTPSEPIVSPSASALASLEPARSASIIFWDVFFGRVEDRPKSFVYQSYIYYI